MILFGEAVANPRPWADPLNWRDPRLGVDHPQGFSGPRQQKTTLFAFGETLARRTGLPLRLVNEHLSSAEAERLLRERGVKPEKRKLLLDAAAAAVILSELLEDRRIRGIPVASLD